MARMKVKGFDKWLDQIGQLESLSRETVGEVINAGSYVIADAVRAEIQAIPVKQQFAKPGQKINTITSVQKAGLLDGFGIAPVQDKNGKSNRKVGFEGYNRQRTQQWPGGVPNAVVARSVCSGTSFREKNDFIGRASRRVKRAAEQAMKDTFERSINSATK